MFQNTSITSFSSNFHNHILKVPLKFGGPFSAFQQLEIDYIIAESHKELLPNSSGQAAILRIFGVTKEGLSIFNAVVICICNSCCCIVAMVLLI